MSDEPHYTMEVTTIDGSRTLTAHLEPDPDDPYRWRLIPDEPVILSNGDTVRITPTVVRLGP